MAKILSFKILHSGWSTFRQATIELDDGTQVVREIEDHGVAAAVLPYDPERRMALLVRQMRNGALLSGAPDPRLLEAPAGLIDAGEDAETAVRREAMEEVGVELTELELIVNAFSMPGVSTERLALFVGAYSQAGRTGAGGGLASEHENIEVIELPLAELARMADAGDLIDLKTLALVLHLRLKRPDLFDAAV
jgi:nudix-type nucleoside diphosphatase (YffH/AdpP family)